MFAISLATLKRYLKRQRETGDVRAKSIPGRPAKKGAALQAGLQPQLDAYPDATRGSNIASLGNDPRSAGQFRDDEPCDPTPELDTQEKDGCRASEQKEEDRAAWREQAQTLDAGKLVFIDECGSNIALTRLYARSRDPESESMVPFRAIDERILRF